MAAASTTRDPRSVITPDAFRVSPDLLGLQLAPPGRRLGAILVDLVCIGILTVVTRNFAVLLGVVISIALIRGSARRLKVPGDVFDRARRASIGCLGVFVGLVTLIVWAAVTFDASDMVSTEFNDDSTAVTINLGSRSVTLGEPSADSARASAPSGARTARERVSLLTLEEALDRYVTLQREDSPDPMDRQLVSALEERFTREFASDTLRALDQRIGQLEREARVTQRQLDAAQDQLDQEVSGGIVSWFREVLDDIGFGFGWAALYMTVLLSMTNGQTLGKRLFGIRVLRLDGQRLNWWVAFERAGGYAAGFATGLLGFAQVYWDANRQAIHDRIVGTVVIREGAPRIEDWESAL